jgi:hypothetical protein
MNKLNRMGKSITWFAVVALLVGSMGFWLRPAAEAAPTQKDDPTERHNRNPFEGIDVTGNILSGGTFRGEMDIISFYEEGNQLLANGFLEGTLRDANGRRIGDVENIFVTGIPADLGTSAQGQADAPVQASNDGVGAAPVQTETVTPATTVTATRTPGVVSCSILRLDLGPLDLNLLGLRVQLNDIHLRITAEPGPGNLLGNLLCAVAHLLDGGPIPGQLNQIISLLNRIIDLLGG